MTGTSRSTAALDAWLGSHPRYDGIHHISRVRDYAADEAAYDGQHNLDASLLASGRGLVTLLREMDARLDGAALEIGAGTGHISLGLIESGDFERLLLTDPSPAFLDLLRSKVRGNGLDDARARYGVLLAEDVAQIPAELLSLIVLRSCLHHFLDYEAFLRTAAARLAPGGALVFQEPCAEGFLLMASVLQFLPLVMEREGTPLREEHRRKIDEFAAMVRFYCRNDVDKSGAEDKHLFRVVQLTELANDCGLSVRFLPNVAFEYFAWPPEARGEREQFVKFFELYLRYLMSWPEDLLDCLQGAFRPYLDLIEEIDKNGAPIYLHGVFVCRKP